jgi:hypothetical protein
MRSLPGSQGNRCDRDPSARRTQGTADISLRRSAARRGAVRIRGPGRRLIRQVLRAVAEFDRRVTVLKLRAARERLRGRGKRCEGRKPFGSRPGEQKSLARIRELHRKPHGHRRRSLQQICDTLNAEGVPTRSGKPWTRQVIRRIINRGLSVTASPSSD